MKINENTNCPNCGAPITTEICPYCNTATGINTATANMEFPVIECREANLGFFNTVFPLFFAIPFGFFGFVFPFLMADEDIKNVSIMFFLFGLVGLVALSIVIYNVGKYILVKTNGKEIDGIVYGYMADNMLINGNPAQIVKIKVITDEGPKFILYQTGDIKQPFEINSSIKLKVYKNIFRIETEKKTYF